MLKKTFEQQKINNDKRQITNRETICTHTFLKNTKISSKITHCK